MFNPTEIIFAVTTACNLHCPHCFVNREPNNLSADEAIQFLESVHNSTNSSIEKVGFSGGEPFLSTGFLTDVIKAAIDMDFMFDRIMTNGDWWKSDDDLRTTLKKIYDAGYDGKIGLSYDNFHGQSEDRIVTFIQTVWDIFGTDSLEIQSVKNSNSTLTANSASTLPSITEKLKSLAERLKLTYEENIAESGLGIASLSDDGHFLPAYIQTESYQANDSRAWQDKSWFKDEHCAEMGQIIFVHATGDIAPCCGFANENPALFIGKITDSFGKVMENAGQNRMMKICYEEGLSKQIKILEKEGKLPQGKTSDICTFCDLVCRRAVKSEE